MDAPYDSQPYLTLKVTRQSGPISKNKRDSSTEPYFGVAADPKPFSIITQPTKIYMKEITESETSSSLNSTTNSSTDNIYLGATFDSYFTITNESIHYVRDVGLKIELLTSSQRLLLADNTVNGLIPLIEPGKVNEFVIKHEIKELGVHNIVCSYQYTTNESEKKFVKKYYRFHVLNPFAVKTKVNNMGNGTVFLEVQIQNVAERFMYLEKMKFEPGEVFDYQDLNYVVENGKVDEIKKKDISVMKGKIQTNERNDNEEINLVELQDDENSSKATRESKDNLDEEQKIKGSESTQQERRYSSEKSITSSNQSELTVIQLEQESIFGNNSYLNPHDVRQYLYMLTPKSGIEDRIARTSNALGKLDIVWRSNLGETGRLQTSQLSRKSPVLDDIELSVTTIPSLIQLEIPFKLGCRIRNRTTSTFKVSISAIKNKMGSVLLSGPSSEMLGELAPDGTIDFNLEFFPLSPGLQRVGGLKIMDRISGDTKEIDHFTDIFVLFS
ncbi:11840_t:CDS:1 [Cetraspora pellucida]|uniref:11840_t:CDS:1 n=1 Tax=Cetraspora pellucida TaxID=1433469 RepID=A0ACA9MM68_9GLOM|nr:11840_t:CDS:1 [Cetraspora pellucida]